MGVTAVLYVLANIAYFSAASKEEILNSKVVAAGVFFEKVFGTGGASKALNFLICMSAFGNLLAVLIGQSRMLRECGRSVMKHFVYFGSDINPLDIDKVFCLSLHFGLPRDHSEHLSVPTL